jgi:hypothetical protein
MQAKSPRAVFKHRSTILDRRNSMLRSRQTNTSRYRVIPCVIAFFSLPMMISPLRAQQPEPSALAAAWHSDQATQLIGMPEVKANIRGSLSISPDSLIFTTPNDHAFIDRVEILAVTIGDVQVESGGTAGKITRAIIPFGGGAAVATLTHKQFSLLTVEFRDNADAFHGAVFLLPKDEAVQAQQQLGSLAIRAQVERPLPSCKTGASVHLNTLKVASIATAGESIPAEYRVLLYEQLVQRLRSGTIFAAVYRDGDDSAAAECPGYNLTLTLDTFKKGNAALRASTGPVGFFVGATSLKFHALVQDAKGGTLLDKDFTVSKRGDSDSLDVTDKIARELTKELAKASKRQARS